jgi:hypothetical protein
MKKPITPIGIIAVFIVFILAQSSVSYSSMPTVTNNETSFSVRETPQEDTTPDKKKKDKKDKKKDRKDKDTSNWPQKEPNPVPDTFPSANRP